MKKAVITLYVIAAVQAVGTLLGFAVYWNILDRAFYEAGKNMIELCDQRYVRR